MSHAQGRPLREGPVLQQSKSVVKGMKKRWLELAHRADTGLLCLNIYHSSDKAKMKVQLAIDRDFKVVAEQQDLTKKEFGFTVLANNEKYVFAAETDASRKSWVAKLVELTHKEGNLFSIVPVEPDIPSDQVGALLLDISGSHVSLLEPSSRQVQKMYDLHHILAFGYQGDRVTLWMQLCTQPTCHSKGPEEVYLRADSLNIDKIITSLTEALETAMGEQCMEENYLQRQKSFNVLHICVQRAPSLRARPVSFAGGVPALPRELIRSNSQTESPGSSPFRSRKSNKSLKVAQQSGGGGACSYDDDDDENPSPYERAGRPTKKIEPNKRPLPALPTEKLDPYIVSGEIFEKQLHTPNRDSGFSSSSSQTSSHSSGNSGSGSGIVHLPEMTGGRRVLPPSPAGGMSPQRLPSRNSAFFPSHSLPESPTIPRSPSANSPFTPSRRLPGASSGTNSPSVQPKSSPSTSLQRGRQDSQLPPPPPSDLPPPLQDNFSPPSSLKSSRRDLPLPSPPSSELPPPPPPATSRLPSTGSPISQNRLPNVSSSPASRSARLPPSNSPRTSRLPPSSIKLP